MVAGGNIIETSTDSIMLCNAGYMREMYTEGELLFNWLEGSAAVDAGWEKAGVT